MSNKTKKLIDHFKHIDDLELLENYRKNSEIIEKMKPLMFLLKLQENN